MKPSLKAYWTRKGATVMDDGTKHWPCGCHTTRTGAFHYCHYGETLRRRRLFLRGLYAKSRRINLRESPHDQWLLRQRVKNTRRRLRKTVARHYRGVGSGG